MSTTHCETNIVRIRVDLLNDILRFDYVLHIFLLCRTNYCNFMAQVYFCWACSEIKKMIRGFGPTMTAYKGPD